MDERQKAEKLRALRKMMESVPADVSLGTDDDAGEAPSSQRRLLAAGNADKKTGKPRSSLGKDVSVADDASKGEERKDAWKRILALCSHSEFCTAKMTERLKREEYAASDIAEAVDRAVRVGLIDDVRWGEMRLAALMRKGEGRCGIERELRQNGIAPEGIPGWPEEYEERFGTEVERACKVLASKPIRSKNVRASAYARLVRKGYAAGVASEAVSRMQAQLGA